MKNCRLIEFKKIGSTENGYLTSLEMFKNIPFQIKRVYFVYNVPKESKRGFHAHKKLDQILICVNGKVKVKVTDLFEEEIIELDSPKQGLYIGSMIWHEIFYYTDSTVLMVLASDYFNEIDYIRDFSEFIDRCKSMSMCEINEE